MAWRIHRWSAKTGTGAVVSPHWGPRPFGPGENPDQTPDFEVGEAVLVELDRTNDDCVVRSVIAARQRQPEGTDCPALREINRARPADMRLEDNEGASLTFWLGDCCEWCGDGWLLTFRDARADGLDEDTDLDHPLLRLASEEEAQERSAPADKAVYCIVTNHGSGRDGPRIFVVASGVEVQRRPRVSGRPP